VKVSGRLMLKSVIKSIMMVLVVVEVVLVLVVAAVMMAKTVVFDLVMEVMLVDYGVYIIILILQPGCFSTPFSSLYGMYITL
jgi:hypothetical protein